MEIAIYTSVFSPRLWAPWGQEITVDSGTSSFISLSHTVSDSPSFLLSLTARPDRMKASIIIGLLKVFGCLTEECRDFAITSVHERWSLSSSWVHLWISLPKGSCISLPELWVLYGQHQSPLERLTWVLIWLQLMKLEEALNPSVSVVTQNLEVTISIALSPSSKDTFLSFFLFLLK